MMEQAQHNIERVNKKKSKSYKQTHKQRQT
jgi:hypothetical protein